MTAEARVRNEVKTAWHRTQRRASGRFDRRLPRESREGTVGLINPHASSGHDALARRRPGDPLAVV
jgi:hypothetical protein